MNNYQNDLIYIRTNNQYKKICKIVIIIYLKLHKHQQNIFYFNQMNHHWDYILFKSIFKIEVKIFKMIWYKINIYQNELNKN